jgi:TonB family protein
MVVVMNTAVIRNGWTGRTIDGRFPLRECLGDTGVEFLFRTELETTPSKRAVIRLIRADAEGAAARVEAWAAASKLSHPHLMRIFQRGRGEIDAVALFYVVTEFAEESLSEVIPERPLTPDETRELLGPILDALSYLHGNGVTYGHIKPSNILVVDNQLKLPVDNLPGTSSKASPESGIYDAPETAAGTMSPASDVWSLGVTLVEALTQHPPSLDRSRTSDPAVPESLPQPFANIARGCLRADVGKRLTLTAIRAALDPARPAPVRLDEVEKARIHPVSKPAELASRPIASRSRAPLLIAGLAVIVAVIVFLIAHSRRPQAPSPSTSTEPAPNPAPPPAAPSAPASTGSTSKGEVTERVSPDIPESATRTIHGKIDVVVRVAVDANGAVSDASFVSPGHSKYFADRALSAARNWKFRPPQVKGEAAASVWNLHFQFRRNGTDINAREVTP